MSQRVDSAVVIGGSMTGLVAARVLADHCRSVTVVERDPLPKGPESRPGVPQGFQLHLLLSKGRDVLEELFPGLDAALEAVGAPVFDPLADTEFVIGAGRTLPVSSTARLRTASRVRLEWEVRKRVSELPNVKVMDGTDVLGLKTDAARTRVEGVAIGGTTVPAQLVVDATGRASRSPAWLQELGFSEPPTLSVNSHLFYSTRWYRRHPMPGGVQLLFSATYAPQLPRAGVVLQVEGDQAMGLVAAYNERTPTDEAGFLEFAKGLLNPHVYEWMKEAAPTTAIKSYGRTDNQWRQYHRCSRLLEGLIPMGDAVCAFNPFYGQGMTVGALEARLLSEELRKGGLEGLSRRAQQRFSKVVNDAWLLATSEDYRWPGTEGPKVSSVTRLGHRYLDHVQELCTDTAAAARAFSSVAHMHAPATALFHPSIALRVLGRVLRGIEPLQGSGKPPRPYAPAAPGASAQQSARSG